MLTKALTFIFSIDKYKSELTKYLYHE